MPRQNVFSYSYLGILFAGAEIRGLNSDIPTKIIQDNIGIFTPILHQEFNKSLELGKFPFEMKLADVTPVFKKEDQTNKENYRSLKKRIEPTKKTIGQ